MAIAREKTFGCTVIAPAGKLLDCRATAVTFPAYDGQVGVLFNHTPMFCLLGLGIMKVRAVTSDKYTVAGETDLFLLIDGGFALIASNTVTIIAYDAISAHDTKPGKLSSVIEKAARDLSSPTLTRRQRLHDTERLAQLHKLSRLPQSAPSAEAS